MSKAGRKLIFWTPRIISILFIGFLTLFSFDVFEPGLTAGQIALAFFMHNIPVIILAVILAIAWTRNLVGAVAFTLVGSLFLLRTVMIMVTNGFDLIGALSSLILIAPSLLTGALFFVGWSMKRKTPRDAPAA